MQREFISRASASCETEFGNSYEIILVDDGSPDNCISVVKLKKNHPRLKIIQLSRNFGHHKAMLAGLDASQGDLVFLIDTDLRKPEWLISFHKLMKKTGADVVYGAQEKKRDKI